MIRSTTTLVGRRAELARVSDAVEAATAGLQIVTISGPAGIGKSRLATESLNLARARGFVTLTGGSGPLEQDLSYAPIVQALRPLLETGTARRQNLTEGLLPDLSRLWDGLNPPASPQRLNDAGLERTRLFDAVRRFLERAAARTPIALLLDDVHWADAATRALLSYLTRGLTASPILLVLTYRSDEPADDSPTMDTTPDALLATLRRLSAPTGILTELLLPGLDNAQMLELATDLLGGPPPTALLTLLDERAGGVPLFVQALVSMLFADDSLKRVHGRWVLLSGTTSPAVPGLVRPLLEQRLRGLPTTARQVFEMICLGGGLAGGGTSHPTLAGATGAQSPALMDAIGHLRTAGFITEELEQGTVIYRPAHPMLAEVTVQRLPVAQLQTMHAKVAATLAETPQHGDIRLLAHHMRGAGPVVPPAQALPIMVEAVDLALERRAGDEAMALAQTALELLGAGPASLNSGTLSSGKLSSGTLSSGPSDNGSLETRPPDGADRARLLHRYAEGAELAGLLDQALSALLQAATSGTPTERAERLGKATTFALELGRFEAAWQYLAEADALIADLPPGPQHITLTEIRLRQCDRAADVPGHAAALVTMAELARVTGSTRARAVQAYAQIGQDMYHGDTEAVMSRVDQLLELGRDLDNPHFMERALRPVENAMLFRGDLRGTEDVAREGQRLARLSGVPTLEAAHLVHLAVVEMLRGHYEDAIRLTDQAIDVGDPTRPDRSTAMGMIAKAFVLAHGERLDAAAELLTEVQARFGHWVSGDRHIFGPAEMAAAEVALQRGDPDAALKTSETALGGMGALQLFAREIRGRTLVAAGRYAQAHQVADDLRAPPAQGYLHGAYADRIDALAEAAQGRSAAAYPLFARAADSFEQMELAPDAALARVAGAEQQILDPTRGSSALATGPEVTQLRSALEVLIRTGRRSGADRCRRVLRALGQRSAPAPADSGDPTGRFGDGELSARELDVVHLVAAGLSNPEIAERLFISRRTVTTHLQNVYAKLDLKSRTALVGWVLREIGPASDLRTPHDAAGHT